MIPERLWMSLVTWAARLPGRLSGAGEWHTSVVCMDGRRVRVYVDGSLVKDDELCLSAD